MDRLLKSRLYDIATAIDEIYSFFDGVPKRFDYSIVLIASKTAEN